MISPVNTHSPNNQSWLVVALFAFAAFIFNTTEFIPIGLLPNIAISLHVPESQTGLLMTIYAWSVTILSIPLTLAVSNIERKKLLMILFLIFIVAHLLSASAWSYTVLTVSRLMIACVHAIFWSISIPLAMRFAPNGDRAKALAFIVTGSSLATVLGVPIGTAIGQQLGWRVTFYLIAGIATLVLLLLIKNLPISPSQNAGNLKSLPLLIKRPTLMQAFLLTALTVTGYFTAYTYITPYLREIGGFDEKFVIVVLFVMGSAGILGSILFTHLIRKMTVHTYTIGAGLLLTCLLCLQEAQSHAWSMLLVALTWGIAVTLIFMSLQNKILEQAADAADLATAIFSGTFNIGIGGGAFIGSIVLDHLGILHIAHIGAVFIFIALVFFLLISRHSWNSAKLTHS